MAMPSAPLATTNNSAVAPPPPPFRPPIAAGASNNGDSHLKLPSLTPHTPSRPPDVILIPSYSRWFYWKNIDECEVRNLPEFFEERSASKNPRVYKYYRNSIIQRFRQNPTRKITFTEARKTIIGDVGSVRRVFDFLEAWGLINYFGAPSSKPQKLEDKDTSKTSNSQASTGATVNDGGAVASGADSTASKKRVCGICKSVCSIACFAREKDDVTLCARCFVRGSYKVGPGPSDFRRVEISDEEKTDWTDKETLHLLEAVMHYRDDWKKVAEHVNGRTVRECVSHFVKLSFGEQFIGPLDSAEVNDNINQSTGQTGKESVSQTSTVPPAKKMRLNPLADASNPIMAQAAFLSALVGVDVAEAAAHAAIWALYGDFNGTNFKEKIGSCTGGNTRNQDVHRRFREYNEGDEVMLRHRTERLPPGAWKKVHAKRTSPFRIRKRVGTNAYELDLSSGMTIGPVFNVEDLTPFHGPADIYPSSSLSSPDIPSSSPLITTPVPSSPIDQISTPPVLVPPPPPYVSSQQTVDVPVDVLDERYVPTRRGGGYQQYLVYWSGRSEDERTWISASEFRRLAPDLFVSYTEFSSTEPNFS